MFVHDLGCGWVSHPFLRNRFLATQEDVARIQGLGLAGLVIDSSKGADVDDSPTLAEAEAAVEGEMLALAAAPVSVQVPLVEELRNAAVIRAQASHLVKTVMQDVRLGKAIDLDRVAPVVESVTASILRNASALLTLSRIRTKDEYTLTHSVAVCTLLVAFCRSRNLDGATMYEAGIGGLLHDTGKAFIPDHILNKPGRLTAEEFEIVRRHPRDGYDVLRGSPGIGAAALDITLHHHERRDGTGYPERHVGSQISELTRMAAIVDVYDAITADRCYHKGISPAEALRKLLEWSKTQFDESLTHEFVRCVGIYPVGTLVLLESGRLAVVAEPHATSLLTPKVNVFFSTRSRAYLKPETVDLARPIGFGGGDRIVRVESPEKWNVDPFRFLAVT